MVVSTKNEEKISGPTVDTGDFKDKQFSEQDVSDKVVEQYDAKQARVFYKYVMGGGGMDIHYGVFTKESDTVYEASKETNNRLMTSLDWTYPITPDSVVLDLGSGHGGLSHELAAKYKCKVVGANISKAQNEMNLEEAKVLGLDELISVELLDFNDGLPEEWTNKFTHVISCEVFCHAANKVTLFQELLRVMKPGAGLAFTDIMGAEGANEKVLKDFTDRNATTKMARPSEYISLLKNEEGEGGGFLSVSFMDFSQHLIHFFTGMRNQVLKYKDDMMAEEVSETYLDKWMSSLTSRIEVQDEHKVFAWGIFTGRKEGPTF